VSIERKDEKQASPYNFANNKKNVPPNLNIA